MKGINSLCFCNNNNNDNDNINNNSFLDYPVRKLSRRRHLRDSRSGCRSGHPDRSPHLFPVHSLGGPPTARGSWADPAGTGRRSRLRLTVRSVSHRWTQETAREDAECMHPVSTPSEGKCQGPVRGHCTPHPGKQPPKLHPISSALWIQTDFPSA